MTPHAELLALARRLLEFRTVSPRVHENGFIQLDLDPGYKWSPDLKCHPAAVRLHVWPDGPIRHQRTSSPIHDHRFGFESTVICGVLHNVCYEFLWGGESGGSVTHQVYAAREGKLWPTEICGTPRELYHQVVSAGGRYHARPGELHESRAEGLTATVMVRTELSRLYVPRVLCPVGEPPDNGFDRESAEEPEVLWGYIGRALAAAPER